MKLKFLFLLRRSLLLLLPVLTLALAGCSLFSGSGKKIDPMAPPEFVTNVGETNVPHLHIGDVVSVTFTGLPEIVEPLDKPIKEDGTITLPDVGRVKAAGKTLANSKTPSTTFTFPKFTRTSTSPSKPAATASITSGAK